MTTTNKISGTELMSLISTIVLARHGNAKATEPEHNEQNKPLTDFGLCQAEKLRAKLANNEFAVVFSSPLRRAVELTVIVAGKRAMYLPSHGVSADETNPLNVMFGQLKYASLQAYFDHELGEHIKEGGRQTLTDIVDHMRSLGSEKPLSVFIGGHAVMTNSVVWAIGEVLADEFPEEAARIQRLALSCLLGEAEALQVNLEGIPSCIHIAQK